MPGNTLADGRAEIERIDAAMIQLIAERLSVGVELLARKRAAGLPTLDPAQEARVIRRAAARARAVGIPEEPVRDIFWRLVALTRGFEDASR